jgi:hypothetical protein
MGRTIPAFRIASIIEKKMGGNYCKIFESKLKKNL